MWANVESSRGLIFSQQVLLALVDKGLSREVAYQIVQRNAMRSWDQGEDFRDLLRTDPEAQARLSSEEMERIFDYSYYTRYIDDTFQRVGLIRPRVSA
jgi:adenylosuccinate lyase